MNLECGPFNLCSKSSLDERILNYGIAIQTRMAIFSHFK